MLSVKPEVFYLIAIALLGAQRARVSQQGSLCVSALHKIADIAGMQVFARRLRKTMRTPVAGNNAAWKCSLHVTPRFRRVPCLDTPQLTAVVEVRSLPSLAQLLTPNTPVNLHGAPQTHNKLQRGTA